MDNSVITYAESHDSLEILLKDDFLRQIYVNIHNIFYNVSFEKREYLMHQLVRTYNGHYLVFYFFGIYYSNINNIDASIICYNICI